MGIHLQRLHFRSKQVLPLSLIHISFGLLSYRPHAGEVDISIRLEDASGIRDLETGEVFAPLTVDMHPEKRFDSAKIPEALTEQHYKVSIENGEFRFFEVLRKEHA